MNVLELGIGLSTGSDRVVPSNRYHAVRRLAARRRTSASNSTKSPET